MSRRPGRDLDRVIRRGLALSKAKAPPRRGLVDQSSIAMGPRDKPDAGIVAKRAPGGCTPGPGGEVTHHAGNGASINLPPMVAIADHPMGLFFRQLEEIDGLAELVALEAFRPQHGIFEGNA